VIAGNALSRAELDVKGAELLPAVNAEKNQQTLEEARAIVTQLKKTNELKDRAAAADLRILEIQRDRARNAWDHATSNATKMRITSPSDGLVVLKSIYKQGTMGEVQEGEEVRSGIPILEVVDPTTMRVRANINQADAASLTAGATVTVTLDSYPSRSFPGKVEYVSPVAMTSSMSQRVRTFLAVFSVNATDEHLLPDLAAAVDVVDAPGKGSR
jgi:HlyD family secretion protein